MAVRVRVLGPVEVATDSGVANLGSRTKALVAGLAARRGEAVSTERLAEAIWGNEPPSDPPGAIQTLVSRLRSSTSSNVVETAGNGYRMDPDAVAIDSVLFERQLSKASELAPAEALALLDEALALWRGDAFADASIADLTDDEARRLDELHLVAHERRFRRLLECGRAEEAVGPLEAFVARHPLRERAVGLLLEALARSGRDTDALRRYAEHRSRLADETGLEPSAELQELEFAILTRSLDPKVAPAGTPPKVAFPLVLRTATTERRPGEAIAWANLGSGPPLMYLPGWISSLEAFADGSDPRSLIVASLAEHFEVTLFDRYGTGMSRTNGVVDTSLAASADEVRTLLDRSPRPMTLFASSASGPVAIAAAAANPAVSSLVLLCTFASGPTVFRNESATESLLGLVRSSWGMGSRVLANLILPGVDAASADAFARFQRRTTTTDVAAGYLEQMMRAETSHLLANVTQPTLIMHYRQDPAIPFEGARQLARGLPNAELVTLDGPYHVPPAAHIESITKQTTDFIERLG